ncbi:peroxisomal membrane protein 4 [Fomitiporia mediterranea MF3/22]|uniref:peroxisomal membrane protein 4 n=1 Tax=Fomitiporia mediterranea (strain MF3/22) TaxID=694068 RepID=UPI0004407911|nr:peroxisomal membrane protein 4 [Fomitiporia mediterranea MF3/22]EJD04324.1 peroxisomal membrane protein 4 [Fomitiporia mediterranea MF3/22]
MSTINSILSDPHYHDIFAVLKGIRNAVVYGVKIRFPHALIMSILFGKGDWSSRIRMILRMTRDHAVGLAKFVTLFKIMMIAQRRIRGGKSQSSDTFFAGLVGGYIVFGDRTPINEQIVLYVVSRVVASFLSRERLNGNATPATPAPPGSPARPMHPDARQFSVFAAIAWGAVMWLFENRSETIQPGMWSSMKYLYKDSETWDGLRTLLWRNK